MPDPEGQHLLVLARDPEGYRRLCAVISAAQLAGGERGARSTTRRAGRRARRPLGGADRVPQGAGARRARHGGPDAAWRELTTLTEMFGHENVMVELNCHHDPGDDERNDVLARLAAPADVGVVATGNVHFAVPAQARLGQALAAIRARRSLDDIDGWLPAAGTAYLRSGAEMAALLRRYPGVLERTVALGRQCAFDFSVIAPKLPDFPVPAGSHRGRLAARTGGAQGAGPVRAAGRRAGARRLRADRQGTRRDRAAGVPRLLPDRARHRGVLRARRTSCARAGVRRPTRRCASRSASPASTRSRTTCCSSGSCPRAGTGRRTSTWTSSTAAARRSSSTSTATTAGTGPPRSPT